MPPTTLPLSPLPLLLLLLMLRFATPLLTTLRLPLPSCKHASYTRLLATQSDRITALHRSLENLHQIDPSTFVPSSLTSLGPSALKSYETYVSPRDEKLRAFLEWDDERIEKHAERTSNQISFLIKRYRSAVDESIRNTDLNLTSVLLKDRFPLILLCDNLRSAFNVGSLFRSCDACNVECLVTTGITPSIDGAGGMKVLKTALGAEQHVNYRHYASTMEACQELKKEGYKIIAMETTKNAVSYVDYNWTAAKQSGVVLVLGNEVTGVDPTLLNSPVLDAVVEIPMFGAKNSLNVASAGPVVMYEVLRAWGYQR